MSRRLRAFVATAALALAGTGAVGTRRAAADEVRLFDGEVLFGSVTTPRDGRLDVATPAGVRHLARTEVAAILPGEPPVDEVRRREATLPPDDAAGLQALARFAWSRHLDDDARRLLDRALSASPEAGDAGLLLGRVARNGTWVAGAAAPWPPIGTTGPRWGAARQRALRAAGVGPDAEAAARRALDWLARHQDEDGKIDADGFERHCPSSDPCGGLGGGHHGERVPCGFDGAVTAVAALAWSAGGSTPTAGPYAENLARAVPWLVQLVERGPGGFDQIWNHAFAVEALADVAAAARDPALLDVVERGVGDLLRLQRPDGGWSYIYDVGDVPTTSVVLSAIGIALQCGVGVPEEVVDRALAFLDARVDSKTGRSEYHEGAELSGYTPTRANAAGALAARAAVGRLGGTTSLARQLAAASSPNPAWKIETKDVKTPDGRTVHAQVGSLYPLLWYEAAFAFERRGLERGWRRALVKALLDGQAAAGHANGSWAPLGPYSEAGGRPFVTALAALMLLEPCRFPREG